MHRAFTLFVLLCISSQIAATEKILLPLIIGAGGIPGAHGSLWSTELVGHNPSAAVVRVAFTRAQCVIPEGCPDLLHAPGETFSVPFGPVIEPGAGTFMYVGDGLTPNAAARAVRFNLRVQDVSRQALTWGTELPVVREDDLFVDAIELLNVPTDARFRQALRIYDFDSGQTQVGLRIYRMDSATPLVDTVVPLAKPFFFRNLDETVAQATFVNLLAAFPELPANDRLRVQVRPITPGLRFWAFISVTNNETQHVTTITPD